MKATGMVRTTERLGRVCIPKEIRRKLHICDGDAVEFFVDGDNIILRRYDAVGDVEQLLQHMENSIHLCEPVVPAAKVSKLLGKVKDMRRILADK